MTPMTSVTSLTTGSVSEADLLGDSSQTRLLPDHEAKSESSEVSP